MTSENPPPLHLVRDAYRTIPAWTDADIAEMRAENPGMQIVETAGLIIATVQDTPVFVAMHASSMREKLAAHDNGIRDSLIPHPIDYLQESITLIHALLETHILPPSIHLPLRAYGKIVSDEIRLRGNDAIRHAERHHD